MFRRIPHWLIFITILLLIMTASVGGVYAFAQFRAVIAPNNSACLIIQWADGQGAILVDIASGTTILDRRKHSVSTRGIPPKRFWVTPLSPQEAEYLLDHETVRTTDDLITFRVVDNKSSVDRNEKGAYRTRYPVRNAERITLWNWPTAIEWGVLVWSPRFATQGGALDLDGNAIIPRQENLTWFGLFADRDTQHTLTGFSAIRRVEIMHEAQAWDSNQQGWIYTAPERLMLLEASPIAEPGKWAVYMIDLETGRIVYQSKAHTRAYISYGNADSSYVNGFSWISDNVLHYYWQDENPHETHIMLVTMDGETLADYPVQTVGYPLGSNPDSQNLYSKSALNLITSHKVVHQMNTALQSGVVPTVQNTDYGITLASINNQDDKGGLAINLEILKNGQPGIILFENAMLFREPVISDDQRLIAFQLFLPPGTATLYLYDTDGQLIRTVNDTANSSDSFLFTDCRPLNYAHAVSTNY